MKNENDRLPPDAPSNSTRTVSCVERLRAVIRQRNYSPSTERAYVDWVRRFRQFHKDRSLLELGETEIQAFLVYLANNLRVSASTQSQTASALMFFYEVVLERQLQHDKRLTRPKLPHTIPAVLSRAEVTKIIENLSGVYRLIASLLYGSGFRLMECLRLRVKDLDFGRGEVVVRDGKGRKDRRTMLPRSLAAPLEEHLRRVRQLFDADVACGAGYVHLPVALARKRPWAARSWQWQWVFPASRHHHDRASNQLRRHHVHATAVQRFFREAVMRAGIDKQATCHTLRHSFATHLLEAGYDVR